MTPDTTNTSVPPPAAAGSSSASDRASLRTMRQRRRRVWRNLITFVVITATMVVLVVARRDQQELSRCLETMRFAARAFGEEAQRGAAAPVNLPQPHTEGAMDRGHYHYSHKNARDLRPDDPATGLVCCDHPHRLFTRGDGRYVLIAERGAYRVEWMLEPDYQQRAAGLRLPQQSILIVQP
jgi:hypothetical protein